MKAIISASANQQGLPDPFLFLKKTSLAPEPVSKPAPEITPVTQTPASTIQPPVAPLESVTQSMVNATPERPTPIGAKLEMAGAAGNVQSAAAPAATYAGAPAAMQQTAMRLGAGAMAANQISTGANQFMAPNMNGITFGGS
jgi:hypothetical protein